MIEFWLGAMATVPLITYASTAVHYLARIDVRAYIATRLTTHHIKVFEKFLDERFGGISDEELEQLKKKLIKEEE